MNKKGNILIGNSIWVLGVLFGLGIVTLLIINVYFPAYLMPEILNIAETSGVLEDVEGGINFTYDMIKFLPYILFGSAIIYLLILIFRKERVSYYE